MRNYIVKENHIGSEATEIHLYRQTDRDPVTFTKWLYDRNLKMILENFFSIIISLLSPLDKIKIVQNAI